MAKSKLEYIWLDGCTPTQSLRSKTKILNNFSGKLKDCPVWSFDGSSTQQAEGQFSDCLLKPVAICPDPGRKNSYVVMTEVLNADHTPHTTNARATIDDNDNDFWFGFEQEYFLWDAQTNKPYGFPANGWPAPQGPYYCGVGADFAYGRDIVEEHMDLCIDAGLNIEGINAEVALGQWEFQIFAKGAAAAGDQIWIGRFLLERTAEKYGLSINYHPKPLGATDWNGSGMHANFSNSTLRKAGKKATYDTICNAFGASKKAISDCMNVYGAYNDQRLTGAHETQAFDKFSYGISDRGASIRIPIATVENNWKGWLEDRRPASNADPYKVAAVIIKTVKSAKVTTGKAKVKAAPKKKTTAKKVIKKNVVAKKDDLTKVEGIGPKIQQLLNKSGIKTYGELSSLSTKKIKTILDNAGNRFAIHDPKTWPRQAKLAAQGNWEKLKVWQNELSGGK